MVHLPFYLQNSGLRKVKIAQQTAQSHRKAAGGSSWNDGDDNMNLAGGNLLGRSLSNRRLSSESALMSSTEKLKYGTRKGSRKLKLSESVASSIGSNLNKIGGAQDLTKMLLTDDYFSDVNPRSMRRLMNVVYVTGRLLKAFQIDFNWYRLASWINITEQWPFRTSWIIYHYDMFEDNLEDSTPLKSLYEKVRPYIPTLKDTEPLLELDRDERKFDIFLTFHRSSLLVSDLKIFLPFTINLDPYLKKVIKEETQGLEDEGLMMTPARNTYMAPHAGGPTGHITWGSIPEWPTPPSTVVNRRMKPFIKQSGNVHHPPTIMYPAAAGVINWHQPWTDPTVSHQYHLRPVTELSPEVLETKLSSLSVGGVCKLLTSIEDLDPASLEQYMKVLQENNINGRVLLHCDLDELKKLLRMNFGDWEMFRVLIVSLREHEMTTVLRQNETKPVRVPLLKQSSGSSSRERKASIPKITTEKDTNKMQGDGSTSSNKNKQSVMEKQVTLEDQMICGALQTLNEEACEDVLEETEDLNNSEIPQTSVIPPSPDSAQDTRSNRSRTNSTSGVGETDFVLLQSSPIGYWQPVSISVHGNAESLSEHSSLGNSQPPSPVGSRQQYPKSLDTIDAQRKSHKHVVIRTETSPGPGSSNEGKRSRPSSLHLLKDSKIPIQLVRSRSKSIDHSRRRTSETRSQTSFDKLKEKLLHSNPDLNDNSDTESTPLVSQVVTPLTSPESRREMSSSSNSHSDPLSPHKQSHIQIAKKYVLEKSKKSDQNLVDMYEFSPTKSSNDDMISDTSLFDENADSNWFDVTQGRCRTMSECVDSSVSYGLEPGSLSVTASNASLCSKYSQSCGHLYRQDALDSEENIADIYCDPETRV